MSSESRKFRNWILRCDPVLEFSLQQFVEKFAVDVLGRSTSLAAAYATANEKIRWRDVVSLQEDLSARFITPLFVDVDSVSRTCSFCSRPPRNGGVPRMRALRSEARAALLRAVDRLGSRQYEALACELAILSGANRTYLTPPGNEGGIDFFASIRHHGHSHVFSAARHPIRVIGQCKKYAEPVNIDRIRQFIHSIESVRHQSSLVEPHVPSWFRGAAGPVIGWVIAHNGFQSGAVTLAKNHGIVLSDSLDVAEVFAQSHRVPIPGSGIDHQSLIEEAVAGHLSVDNPEIVA